MNVSNIEQAKPVTIISGFLGAGKTTFLNALIAHKKNRQLFIIENEFGKEGIDAGLILAPDADIFELNSGCLCCNLNEDLFDLLEILWERKDEFDELVIETTGIADPATVAQPFLVSQNIEKYYKLERVVCIVDAQLISFELEETEETRRQIVFADIILINKSDTVRDGYLKELEGLLRNINPTAVILSGNNETGYPLKEILALNRSYFDNQVALDSPQKYGTVYKVVSGHKEHHHHGISSLSFVFEQPFNLEWFEHRLMMFLSFQARDIYRVKGFIRAKEEKHKIIVQSVSKMLVITCGEEWKPDETLRSRIVFIGRDLKSKGLEQMLKQCLSKQVSGRIT